jgi:hypothetical protein
MANQAFANNHPPSKKMFFGSLIAFLVSAALLGCFIKLNHHVEKTSGKVIDIFTKKTFASRKQQVDQEYLVVSYSYNGKDYTGKAVRRSGASSEYVPVYFYPAFPGYAWFYKKANANVIYCAIFMLLSVIAVVMTGSDLRKTKNAAAASAGSKKKQGK